MMLAYILRRLLLVVPTLFGIMVVNFFIIQAAPGGPVEQMIAQIQGKSVDATERFSGSSSGGETDAQRPQTDASGSGGGTYRGARGLPTELIQRIEKHVRLRQADLRALLPDDEELPRLRLRRELLPQPRVVDLVLDKMPVSISLGLWTTLLIYLISIPLGIAKAVRDGSRFDVSTSTILIVLNAIPGFLFALLLVVLFAGGSYFKWFPLRGLVSDDWARFSLVDKVLDYLWHMVLPIGAMVIGGFASLDLPHQELVPRGDRQAVRADRARQGPGRAPRALRPRLPQRHADRDRGLSGGLHRRAVHRLAADRGDLLARRHRACWASRRRSTATIRSCSARSISSA